MANDIRLIAEEIAFDFNKVLDRPYIRRLELAILGYRSTIIRDDYNKTKKYSSSLEDSFCLSMIQVKETECCHQGEDGCLVWRTENKVPAPIRVKDNSSFSFVGNTNSTKAYDFINPEDWPIIKKGTRFAKHGRFYAYYNSYIYTFNVDNKKISVRGVFDNPEELLTLKDCDNQPCIKDIRIPQDMKRLIKLFVKEELSGKQIPVKQEIPIDGATSKG